MRRVLLAALAAWSFGSVACGGEALNVLSFNLRYNNAKDGANAWPNRKEMAAEVFKDNAVDLAGLQEALIEQIQDLKKALPEYEWVGVGRDDGDKAGEFAPIFYRRDRLELIRSGHFWLSETPDSPGMGWDAACPRIATWAVFKDRETGRSFFFLNTHLDHIGNVARREGVRLILAKLAELGTDLPVMVTGDFNSTPDSPVVQAMTSDATIPLKSAATLTDRGERGDATFNGFRDNGPSNVIDYIFVNPDVTVDSCSYLVVKRGDVFVSDHWPVLARVSLR